MATAKMVLGMLSGVDRPALATILPTVRGIPSLLLDVGDLLQRRLRPRQPRPVRRHGPHTLQNVLKISNPRVGLLSIWRRGLQGQLPSCVTRSSPAPRAVPGDQLHPWQRSKAATFSQRPRRRHRMRRLRRQRSPQNLQEGTAKLVTVLRESLKSTVTSQVGALLSRRAFDDFKKRLDYSEYGGAPLLGVRGVCIVEPRLLQRKSDHERHPISRRVRTSRRKLRHRIRPTHRLTTLPSPSHCSCRYRCS